MAKDLVLKHSKRNWSRDLDDVAPIASPPAPEAKVKAQTAKLAATKAAAEKDDKKAKKKWDKICKKVARIQKAANAGNPDAAKQMAKIRATGLFATTTSGNDNLTEIVTSGDDKLTEILTSGAFVGRQEILGKDEILGQFVGEEERALAAEGGACEKNALRRRFGVGARFSFPRRNDPYKVKNLHPDYVKMAREQAQKGNEEAQHILEAHNLSW